MVKKFQEIIDGLKNNEYSSTNVPVELWPSGTIVDEMLSDEENRQIVELHNVVCKKKIDEQRRVEKEKYVNLRVDVVKAIIEEYGFSKELAKYIEEFVFAETKKKSKFEYVDGVQLISDFLLGMPE